MNIDFDKLMFFMRHRAREYEEGYESKYNVDRLKKDLNDYFIAPANWIHYYKLHPNPNCIDSMLSSREELEAEIVRLNKFLNNHSPSVESFVLEWAKRDILLYKKLLEG